MQVYEKIGDINKGMISISLSKSEVGYKNLLFIMDYYMIEKNKYSISLFVQEKGNDMLYPCDDRDVESRYSELEQLMKDITYKSLKLKVLQNFCKEYMKEVNSIYEVKTIKTGVLMVVSEQEMENPFLDIEKIERFKSILKIAKKDFWNIYFKIDYREEGEWGDWESIDCILSGYGKELREFLEQIKNQTKLRYKTETTYDENYTNIIIRFSSCGNQLEVKLRLKNDSRYFIKKLEDYIAIRSDLTIINNDYDDVMIDKFKRKEMLNQRKCNYSWSM